MARETLARRQQTANCTAALASGGRHLVTAIYNEAPGFLSSIRSADEDAPNGLAAALRV